jgi:hypothetical protein
VRGERLVQRAVAHPPHADRAAARAARAVAGEVLPQRAERAALASAARQPLAVGAERHRVHVVGAAVERVHERAVARPPDAHARVVAAARQPRAVGAERDADDGLLVRRERVLERPRLGTPQADRPVEAAARDPLAVGAERDRPHVARVPGERA